MRNYIAFLKKEIVESLRTSKALILLIVFFIFGVMNPLAAKFLPEIASMAMTEGFTFTLPEPSAIDSWTQFFKNISQMGMIVVLVLFSGVIANELTKGTLINMLTKGLSRSAVVLSKYTAMILLWTVSYALCFVTTWGYTVYLFPGSTVENLWFAVFGLWMAGTFLLSVLMFAASATTKSYACLLITAGVAGVLLIINVVPAVQKYNPLSLASDSMALLTGTATVNSLYPALVIAVASSLALVAGSVLVFRKRQI